MGEVRRMPVGQISYELSERVAMIRDELGLDCDSNRVIDRPMCDDYDAFIMPNGGMQLGEAGIGDFEGRFGAIDEDISPRRLYVGFFAARSALEHLRTTDERYHDELLELSAEARGRMPSLSGVDVHQVERRLIGHHAARLSSILEVSQMTRPNEQKTSIIAISFAAERRKRSGAETPAIRQQRQRALAEFAFNVKDNIRDGVDASTRRAVRRHS